MESVKRGCGRFSDAGVVRESEVQLWNREVAFLYDWRRCAAVTEVWCASVICPNNRAAQTTANTRYGPQ